jgi:1-acyl-sn-glycerol-3-phosphate acyltransferase
MFDYIVRILRPIALWLSRILYKIEFAGVEHIPHAGPVIFTPNHVSYPDPIWISIPIERRVYYMAWDALFRIPAVAAFLRFFGAFPVRLEGHDRCAYREALEHLAAGHALMIFPEGGRTVTGELLAFKAGAFRLALLTGARVVPVAISGAHDVWPPGRFLPHLRGRIRVVFRPPIEVERAPDTAEPGEIKRRAREIAAEARASVALALDPAARPDELEQGARYAAGKGF